ncbi:hypothetical protein SacxiDRAFT_3003 [Saccharomonospora xinjiangensis XJ-54]|uniref:Uncharacterized protein n=1 Tax=Saccharomonospora xinjiangensis XJ-54 TaxID=882086 RepID=I0V512_9PSEU|nr:hypothetical protein SacxiDRAFT_3003 [Saccharomonospora xinjiangensis XJ-54]
MTGHARSWTRHGRPHGTERDLGAVRLEHRNRRTSLRRRRPSGAPVQGVALRHHRRDGHVRTPDSHARRAMTPRHRVGDPHLHPTNSTNDVGRDVRSHRRDGAGGCRPRREERNRRAANNHLAGGSPAAARAETHLGPSRPGADAVVAHVVSTRRLDGRGRRTGPELS